jgi:histidine ammonia-lyase
MPAMIDLDGHHLTIADLRRAACSGAPCRLADVARPLVRRSRDFVDRLAAEPRAVYGINTGFGALSDRRVAPGDLEKHQLHLLHHLAVGQGALLPPAETRAVMVARANTLARGYSGVREAVIDLLLAAHRHDVLPEIPSEGSVGASGDLVPLAHMARLLIGLGHARVDGRRVPAGEALRDKGLAPLTLRCKEGLALVNGTSVMTALAALSVHDADALLGWSEFLSACLIQVLSGEPETLCEQAHRARGHRGQYVSAMRIAAHVATHPRYAREIRDHVWGSHPKPVAPGVEVQDPYSIRCAPQILGAFQDALWHVAHVVERELNASTDNPLVFPDAGTVIHGGNFYGQQVAMACDYLRTGLITVALLAERQTERLLNPRYNLGLPPMLSGGEPGVNSGLAGAQLLATSLAAEARLLGAPASIQTIPTNANNQDMVSMGTHAARMCRTVVELAWKILSVEALAVAQAADLRRRDGRDVLGTDFAAWHALIRGVSPALEEDRPLHEDLDRVARLLRSDEARSRCLPPRPPNPLTVDLAWKPMENPG